MAKRSKALRDWVAGSRHERLTFSDLWKFILVQIADRARHRVDEEGEPFGRRDWWEYSYDVTAIVDHDSIGVYPSEIQRVALYLKEHDWIDLVRRQPVKAHLTPAGMAKAEELLRDILGDSEQSEPGAVPAADRFVMLDDNSTNYRESIVCLERLITEMREMRVNDWPEKDGMIATISGILETIKAKYASKEIVLGAVFSVVSFVLIKFAETPIVDVANKAWTAVKALF